MCGEQIDLGFTESDLVLISLTVVFLPLMNLPSKNTANNGINIFIIFKFKITYSLILYFQLTVICSLLHCYNHPFLMIITQFLIPLVF